MEEAMPDRLIHEQNMDFSRGVCFQQHASCLNNSILAFPNA